jgi:hypothetical protein
LPIFGRRKKSFPIPAILPKTCPKCGRPLRWEAVTAFDPVIRLEKAEYYKAESECGEVLYRDGRGQVVEPAVENLAPDRSDFANSPQGPQPYSGYMEFVQQERAKAEALKVAQAKKAADAAAAAAAPAAAPGAAPAPGSAPAAEAKPTPTAGAAPGPSSAPAGEARPTAAPSAAPAPDTTPTAAEDPASPQ